MIYDLIIAGGGPAGVAAGVYAARKNLKTLFITPEWGGQSIISPEIQNWIGSPRISGEELAHSLKTHLETYKGEWVEIKTEKVIKAEKNSAADSTDSSASPLFKVTTNKNPDGYQTKAVLVATGGSRRKLTVPGADTYDQKGLTYCASCDGPLFAGQDVVVIGGGNAGFESAVQLLAYCKSVTLLSRTEFKADPSTVEQALTHPNLTAIANTQIVEVRGGAANPSGAGPSAVEGSGFVTSLVYKNQSGETIDLPTTGIFVEIGFTPNTEWVKDLITLTTGNQVVVDPRNQRCSIEGIWAAGDCTDGLYHQNNIAAGDAVKALEDIYMWVKGKK